MPDLLMLLVKAIRALMLWELREFFVQQNVAGEFNAEVT